MKTSEHGIAMIANFEKFSEKVYLDTDNNQVVGYGHIIKRDEKRNYSDGINPDSALELLKEDVNYSEKVVGFYVKVPMNQNQFDALVSFVFNIKQGNFRESMLLEKLNEQDYEGAAEEFEKWCYKKGKKVPGLEFRRKKEKERFLKPVE